MEFRDVEFMTAREKELVLKAWKTFIKHGFQYKHFNKRLYEHLSLHCSFMAHYNRYGFWYEYFEDPNDTVRFLSQFDKAFGFKAVELGMNVWFYCRDYQDLNNAMVDYFESVKKEVYAKLKDEAVTVVEVRIPVSTLELNQRKIEGILNEANEQLGRIDERIIVQGG